MDLKDIATGDRFEALEDRYRPTEPKIRVFTKGKIYRVGRKLRSLNGEIQSLDLQDDTGEWGVEGPEMFALLFKNLDAQSNRPKPGASNETTQ